ncbi:hypothetical protein GAY28_37790, partial [Azospirillum brasilense]|nr:hypothetical protein [Azospirillum brasilense]
VKDQGADAPPCRGGPGHPRGPAGTGLRPGRGPPGGGVLQRLPPPHRRLPRPARRPVGGGAAAAEPRHGPPRPAARRVQGGGVRPWRRVWTTATISLSRTTSTSRPSST